MLICLLFTSLQVDARLQGSFPPYVLVLHDGSLVKSAAKFRGNYGVQYTGLAPVQTARTQMMAGEGEAEAEGEGESEEAAAVPAVPVVPVADNYEAATNADDLITKALEHGTLSAAQVGSCIPQRTMLTCPLNSG